jgi:hypothetical protein
MRKFNKGILEVWKESELRVDWFIPLFLLGDFLPQILADYYYTILA